MSYVGHPLDTASGGIYATKDEMMNLSPLYGPPVNFVRKTPDSGATRETLDMYQLMKDRISYFSTSLNYFAFKSHNPDILKLLPLFETDGLHYRWSKKRVLRPLAPILAPGAMPPLIRKTEEGFQVTLRRHGLAMKIDMETANSIEGMADAAEDYGAIVASMKDTAELRGIALLQSLSNSYKESVLQPLGGYASITDYLLVKKRFWDLLRKTTRGGALMVENAKNIMAPNIPDKLLLAEGARSVVAFDPAEQEYYRGGARSERRVMEGADSLNNLGGLEVLIARAFPGEDNEAPILPLRSRATIGGYGVMSNFTEDVVDAKDFRSKMLDILMFSMDNPNGKFKPLEYMQALAYSQRYMGDRRGSLSGTHDDIASDVHGVLKTTKLSAPNGFLDMYLFHVSGTTYQKVQVFGQMEQRGLPDKAVEEMGKSLAARMKERLSEESMSAIQTALKEADDAYRTPEVSNGNLAAGGVANAANVFKPLYDAAKGLFVSEHLAFTGALTNTPLAQQSDVDARVKAFVNALLYGIKLPVYKKGQAATALGNVTAASAGSADLARILSDSKPALQQFSTDAIVQLYKSPSAFATKYSNSGLQGAVVAEQGSANGRTLAEFITFVGKQSENPSQPESFSLALDAALNAIIQNTTPSGRVDEFLRSAAMTRVITGVDNKSKYALQEGVAVSPEALLDLYAADAANKQFVLGSPSDPTKVIAPPENPKNAMEREQFLEQASLGHSGFDVELLNYNMTTPLFTKATEISAADLQRGVYGYGASGSMYGTQAVPSITMTRQMKERFLALQNEPDMLKRLSKALFLLAPVCFEQRKVWHQQNVMQPTDILILRPQRQYITQNAIAVASGKDLGYTVVGPSFVSTSDNGQTRERTHFVTVHIEPIVFDQKRVCVLPNVLVEDYVGGETLAPLTPEQFKAEHGMDPTASVIPCEVPYGSLRDGTSVSDTIDARGRWASSLSNVSVKQGALGDNAASPHYPSAVFYSYLYEFYDTHTEEDEWAISGNLSELQQPRNLICDREMTKHYNPVKKTWDNFNVNTDPFGPNVYDGHGRLRKGYNEGRYKEQNNESKAVY